MFEYNNVHDLKSNQNGEIYQKKYNKEQIPDNYLENLEIFLKNNQFDKEDGDFSELTFTFDDQNIKNINAHCIYYSEINDNLETVINNCINKLKEIDDIHQNELKLILDAIELLKINSEQNSTYNNTKKAIFLILSTEYGVTPIFIDDIGMKFRLENIESGEYFDSNDYFKLNKDLEKNDFLIKEKTSSCTIF